MKETERRREEKQNVIFLYYTSIPNPLSLILLIE